MEGRCFLHETLKLALKKIWKTFIFLNVTQKLKFLALKKSDFLPVFAGLPTSMSRVGSAIWYLKITTFYFFCLYTLTYQILLKLSFESIWHPWTKDDLAGPDVEQKGKWKMRAEFSDVQEITSTARKIAEDTRKCFSSPQQRGFFRPKQEKVSGKNS